MTNYSGRSVMNNREVFHYLETEQEDFLALMIYVLRYLQNV